MTKRMRVGTNDEEAVGSMRFVGRFQIGQAVFVHAFTLPLLSTCAHSSLVFAPLTGKCVFCMVHLVALFQLLVYVHCGSNV